MTFTSAFEPYGGSGDRWKGWAENPARGILWIRLEGWGSTVSFKFIQDAFDRLLGAGQGPLEGYYDWANLEGYDPDARAKYMLWAKSHPNDVRQIHILIVARMVQAGLSVANEVLGGYVRPYVDRSAWEAERERATAAARVPS